MHLNCQSCVSTFYKHSQILMNTFIKSGKIKGSLVTLLKKILLVLSKQQKIN